jgi:hypothetical protein
MHEPEITDVAAYMAAVGARARAAARAVARAETAAKNRALAAMAAAEQWGTDHVFGPLLCPVHKKRGPSRMALT